MRPALALFLSRLGSLRLTLAAMLALAITSLATYKNPGLSINWVALPLALLGVNLLSAIISNRRFRKQGGLLTFHIGLLIVIVLAALGLLSSLDARLEITEGMEFNPADVEIVHQGPWHRNRLDQVLFTQGKVAVDFVSPQRRSETRSRIWVPSDDFGQPKSRLIGDNRTLRTSGYRFITTGNKGYSIILTWISDHGQLSTGAVHMPSYPMYEWKQDNEWLTPEGQQLLISLQIENEQRSNDATWTLTSKDVQTRLLLRTAENERLLKPGDEARLEGGKLRFEELRLWMGYRIDSNPMLFWQFMAALFAISGLGYHFWHKFSSLTLHSGDKIMIKEYPERSQHA